ncbi:chemotaxis protein CheB [Egicoccus halophilus]|uniref:protein-glutamate methylesterase n=1 Tax=Egicoccus halophilus TaxID=1670830 RepID=A0A8J3ER99_9ACTN|nr:chemotaxis protein CheB [Egicoccus halophilus]GGI04541.1 chemotaxis protein CheB [Egicoccus halophilus]
MSAVRRLLVVGGSWGGITASQSVLRALELPADAATALVLHRQPIRSALAEVLGRGIGCPVEEAEDKMPLAPGRVYVAPPDYHLLVESGWLSLSTEEPVKYSRPAIDVLLESAADAFGPRLVAVILTGASTDGTDGARAVRRRGGTVIVQDPRTAEQPVMPQSVVTAGLADVVAPLRDLPAVIARAVDRAGASA